jgi:hypothetical protein
MDLDRDMNAYSSVFIGDPVGTGSMSIANGEMWWDNDRFGSWLVCQDNNGNFVLYWWDMITNKGIDPTKCAKVQLMTENQ